MNNPINSKLNSFSSLIVAGALTLACTIGASSASADEVSLMHTKVVSYSDLNLDSQAGAAAFYRRVRSAARDVCSSYDGHDVKSIALYGHCFDSAVTGAVSQVNKANVTAIHKQASGRVS
jgi:UrcA family protein